MYTPSECQPEPELASPPGIEITQAQFLRLYIGINRRHIPLGIRGKAAHSEHLTVICPVIVEAPFPVEQVAYVQEIDYELELAPVFPVKIEILGEMQVEMMLELADAGIPFRPLAPVTAEILVTADELLEKRRISFIRP